MLPEEVRKMGKRLLRAVEKELEDEKARGESGMYYSSGHHEWDAHHPPKPDQKPDKKEAQKKKERSEDKQ